MDSRDIALHNFAKLLDFGAKCLETQGDAPIKSRGSKKILYGMVVAAQNYSEAVFVLCRENRTNACLIILRSLCENLKDRKFNGV